MMVRKVLFIHSQGKDELGSIVQLLPVGLLALADFLVRNNVEARVLHLGLEKRIDPAFSISDHIKEEAFDMVCLGLHWHWQATAVFDLAKSLKARNRDIKIVLGGFSASYFYREIMEKHPAVDFIIRGDAELPLLFLAREMASIRPDLAKVPNLSWREGTATKNNPHDYLIDQELLDNLRFTNFTLLKNHEQYLEQISLSFSEAGRESTFFYVPGRGCSVDCSFCGGSCSAQIRLNRRELPIFASSTAVIRELAALSEYGISRVYVAFDPYPGKDYYPELFRAIRRSKLELAMDFEAFALPSEEFIFEFKQTFRPGSTIFISPYTGSDTVRRLNRGMPFSNDGLYACLDGLKKERIKTILGLSAGLAHEDSAGILETMEMIRRIRNEYPDVEMAIEGVSLEPGAPWYIRPDEYGINAKRASLEDFIREAPGGLGYSSGYFSENEINEILALLRAESNCRLASSRIHEYLKEKGRLPKPFSLDALMGECGGCEYYTECFSSLSITADAGNKQEGCGKTDCVLFLPPPGFQFSLPEIGLPQLAAYLNQAGYRVRSFDANADFINEFLPMHQDSAKSRIKDRFDENKNRAVEAIGHRIFLDIDHGSIEESNSGLLRDHGFEYLNELLSVNDGEYGIGRIMEIVGKQDDELFNSFYCEHIRSKVKDARVVGFSILTPQHLSSSLYLARSIKNEFPDKIIVFGGSWCTVSAEYLDAFAAIFSVVDHVVVGEGELALEALFEAVASGGDKNGIQGLVGPGARVSDPGDRAATCDLDELPLPDYGDFVKGGAGSLPLMTSKDCYWSKCRFCHHQNNGEPRHKSVKRIVDEMEELYSRYSPEMVEFADAATPIGLLVDVAGEVERRNIGIKWMTMVRAEEALGIEALKAMKRSGCQGLAIGLECADQESLDRLHKGIKLDVFERILRDSKEAGIPLNIFVMTYPGQSQAEYERTWHYILDRADLIDSAYAQYFQLGRNAEIYLRREEEGIRLDPGHEEDIRSFDLPCECDRLMPFGEFVDLTLAFEKRFRRLKSNQRIMERMERERPRKYLLIRPPFVQVLSGEDESRFVHGYSEPAGLLKIGALLKAKGHSVGLIDCLAGVNTEDNESLHPYRTCASGYDDSFKKEVYWAGMDIVLIEKELDAAGVVDEIFISTCFTYEFEFVRDICAAIRKRLGTVKIVVGGVLASLCPDKVEELGAEAYSGIMHEAEEMESDLGLLGYAPSKAVLKFSRGCPNNCAYCAVPVLEGKSSVFRGIDSLVHEIRHKYEEYGVRHFVFWESNVFGTDRSYFLRLLDAIAGLGLDISISFPEGLQPNLIDSDIAGKMKKAGVNRVVLSFESNAEAFQSEYSRPPGANRLKSAVDLLVEAGVIDRFSPKHSAFVLLALPGQKKAEVLESVLEVWKTGLEVSFTPFTPIPGTPVYEKNREELEKRELLELHPMLWPFASQELDTGWLEKIFICESKSSVFELGDAEVFSLFVPYFQAMSVPVGIEDIRNGHAGLMNGFTVIDIKLGKEELSADNARLIKEYLGALRKEDKPFYLYRPLPSGFIRLAPGWYDKQVPRNCDYCLDIACPKRRTSQDGGLSQRIDECKYYERQ